MAEDETNNEQQPDEGAEIAPADAEAQAPEGDADPTANDDPGADAAPLADDAGTEDGDSGEEAPLTEAEQLAADALAAAKSALAGLNDDMTEEESPEPAAAASEPAQPAPAANGQPTGSMIGPGAASAPMPFTPEQLTQLAAVQGGEGIDILSDVDLNVKIELGKTRMLVEDVLKLSDGAVVELDKLAGDPVDIYVNERHVARGEVLILNDNFCVRVSEILEATIED